MRNGGGGGWSLQGLGRLIRRWAARRGNGEEGRSEGSGDLGKSSPEPGDGGRAREAEGSDAAVRSPCRQGRTSMAGRGAPRPWRGFGFPWYRKEKQKRIQGKEERGFREKKNGGRRMAGLLGACHTI